MKKMKKIISWFLASALTFGCVSLPANAAEIYCLPAETADTPDTPDTFDTPDTAEIPQTHDKDITPIIEEGQCGTEVYYELHESGTVYIFGNGDMYDYYGYYETDTDIIYDLSGVNASQGIGIDEDSPFRYFDNVINVVIEDGVTSIGESAFENCWSMKSAAMADSVKKIGMVAFCNCCLLETVELSDNLLSIESAAFYRCTDLKEIIFPESVAYIQEYAFYGCEKLKTLFLPENLEFLGEDVFDGCISLESIEVDARNTNFSSIDCVLYDKNIETLILCPAKKTSLTLPDTVTEIYKTWSKPDYDSLYFGGSWYFAECTVLESISVDPENQVFASYDGVLYDKSMTKLLRCPCAKKSVEISSEAKEIDSYAFKMCDVIESLDIPGTVETIGRFAFAYCENLSDITLHEGLRTIWESAFYYCGITDIILPENLTYIGEGAFSKCVGLKNVKLPNDLKTLPDCVFEGCSSLESIRIPGQVTELEWCCFGECYNLKEIELPKSLTDIYSYAFNDCSSLTDIYYKSRKDMWDCIYIDEWGNDDLLNADIHYNSRMGETYDEPDTDEYRINFEFVDDRLDIEVYNAEKDTFEAVQGDSIILEGKDLFIHVPLQSINSGKLIMKQPDINIYGKFDYFGTNFMENGQDYYFSISGIRSNIVVEFYFDEDIIPYGDVNGDGKVTAKDAMTAQRYAIKLAELSDEQIIIADVDKNGTVTALDALYILRYSLNLVYLPIKPN